MSRCSNCQKEMPDNARFCASCGQVLVEGEKTVLVRVIRAKNIRAGASRSRPASLAGPVDREDEQKRRAKRRPVSPIEDPANNGPAPGPVPEIQGTSRPNQMAAIANTPGLAGVPATPNPSSPAAPSMAAMPPSTPPAQSFRSVHQPGPVHNTPRVPGGQTVRQDGGGSIPYGAGNRQSGPVHAHPTGPEAGAQPPAGWRSGQAGGSLYTPEPVHTGSSTAARVRAGTTAKILVSILVGIVILAGGVGAFILVRQSGSNQPASVASPQTGNGAPVAPGSSPTPSPTPVPSNIFTVSGSLTGSMTVVSFRACATLGAGYAIFAIVSLNGQQYNLNILFLSYRGPGTYTNTAASDQVNIGLNNSIGGTGTRAWNTSQAHTNGSGIINSDASSGSLAGFTLYSTVDKGTIQLAGNWRCS